MGARNYGAQEKAGGQMASLEQRPRGWAKGRVHASSSETNSTSSYRPWDSGAQKSGSLLGGDRHHAAGTGTTQSDCKGRGAWQRHCSPSYRGRAYQEKVAGPMHLVQGDGKGTWKVDCRVREEARRLYFPRPWRRASSPDDDPANEPSAQTLGCRRRGSIPRTTATNLYDGRRRSTS